MGKVVEMTKTKKKKGRPSLLDLQKRDLKLQQQQPENELKKKHQPQQNQQIKRTLDQFQNPNSTHVRRSSRRNPNPDPDSPGTDYKGASAVPSNNSVSDPEDKDEHSSSRSCLKRRKVETVGDGSDSEPKGKEQGASTNQANGHQEAELDDGRTLSTPLPDKTLLLFILDRLQKKDTYGVFAEPVDPGELPDYHEIIEHPMDFNTIRNNLENGVYKNLKQFEKDVFLLCSNAMQYNAPGSIYFRQAHAIQELANKNFEDLRRDSDGHESQAKVVAVRRRGRPPTKNLMKPVDTVRAHSNYPESPFATRGENASFYFRKSTTSSEKRGSASSLGHISHGSRNGEVYISWSDDKYDRTNDIPGSMPKYILLKHGKEQIILDENRRHTYKLLSASATRLDASVLLTFCGVRKQLVPVGFHSKYGYARSLAQFAAKLGPVAWKIASKKIETCLPAGVKFGPAWVGENEGSIEISHYQTFSKQMHNLESKRNHKSSQRAEVGYMTHQQVLQPSIESAGDLPVCSKLKDTGTSPSVTRLSGSVEEGETCSSVAASGYNSGLPTLAQQSSLAEPRGNGFTIPSQMSKLLGQATPSGGCFKSICSSTVVTSLGTDTLKSEMNVPEGRKLAEETSITGEHDDS